MQGLELSRRFYFEAVRPILERHFPNVEHAAALIGYGSEVLGHDDERSQDHEWGPRVQVFVRDFGPAILAQPPKRGFDLLAWLLPIGGLLIGAVAVGFAAWRWTRSREPEPALAAAGPLDPALERRLDDELRRFDE